MFTCPVTHGMKNSRRRTRWLSWSWLMVLLLVQFLSYNTRRHLHFSCGYPTMHDITKLHGNIAISIFHFLNPKGSFNSPLHTQWHVGPMRYPLPFPFFNLSAPVETRRWPTFVPCCPPRRVPLPHQWAGSRDPPPSRRGRRDARRGTIQLRKLCDADW